MTKSLEEMKDKLYKAFDRAIAHSESDMSAGNNFEKITARSEALQAAAQTAQAITVVEHEIAVLDALKDARERGDRVILEISGGIAQNIKPLNTLKLKPPGG